MAQTSYNIDPAVGYAGQLASTDYSSNAFKVEGSGVTWGLAVTQGTAADQVKALADATSNVVGFVMQHHTADGKTPDEDVVNVLHRGELWVTTEDAATAGGSVFVRAVAAGTEVKGAVRASKDSSDTIKLDNVKFKTSAAAGGLAIISVNLPGNQAATS